MWAANQSDKLLGMVGSAERLRKQNEEDRGKFCFSENGKAWILSRAIEPWLSGASGREQLLLRAARAGLQSFQRTDPSETAEPTGKQSCYRLALSSSREPPKS